MIFGENNEYGLMQEGFGIKVVKIGENLWRKLNDSWGQVP
jgi:hypothetical protein